MNRRLARAGKETLFRAGYYDRRLDDLEFPGVAVLGYHCLRPRSADGLRMEAEGLHVSEAEFDAHCAFVTRSCHPISLNDWRLARSGQKALPSRPVLVTFDDGYRSVWTVAYPILKKYRIPAVIFTCTSAIREQRLTWYDAVSRISGYDEVRRLKELSFPEWWAETRQRYMVPVDPADLHAMMSIEELKALSQDPLIEIGAHTADHPVLARADLSVQLDQIRNNRTALREWTAQPVNAFAFPDGLPGRDYSAETVRLLDEQGFDFGFTTRHAFATSAEPRLEQSRFVMLAGMSPADLAHGLSHSWIHEPLVSIPVSSTVASGRQAMKSVLLGSVAAATGRHPVLLPRGAVDDGLIFKLEATYRVETALTTQLLEITNGSLTATLLGYEGYTPVRRLWTSAAADYDGPTSFEHDLASGNIRLGGRSWGCAPVDIGRRFCWAFDLAAENGTISRTVGHYRADEGRIVERTYYYGDDYVDYAAQSAGEHDVVLGLLKEFHAEGPVLEMGCATGDLLTLLLGQGFEATGIDVSAWAIEQAEAVVGAGRAFRCDAERDPLPAPVIERAPFGTIVMWAVLEHFHKPFQVLASLAAIARPGTTLLINTTNAASFTHGLMGANWEGYFDWTHHGVDQIAAQSLNAALTACGWDVARLTTDSLWTVDADPFAATLRDWFAADARFRRLLQDRDLGDFITCVAVRR